MTPVTANDQMAMIAYQSCLVTQCLNACTPDVNVGPVDTAPGNTPPANPPATVEPGPTPPGPVEPNPATNAQACGVVKPATTCVGAEAFVLEEVGTDLVGVSNPTYAELVVSEVSVKGDWVLENGQLGVLQFKFSAPIDPARVALEGTLSHVEYITLEDTGGSGCQYTLRNGRLDRYLVSTGTRVDWYGCWGDYETYETAEPNTLSIINIRTGVSQLNEARAITLTSMLL